MRLTLEWSDVREVRLGTGTRLSGEMLEVDVDELRALIGADTRLGRVHVDLVQPGESCRIGRVFDVFAPRAKLEGGGDFPGVLGPLGRVGSGRTRALAGVAVVVTDQESASPATLALIDMSAPAVAVTEFARIHHMVVSAWPAAGAGRSEY